MIPAEGANRPLIQTRSQPTLPDSPAPGALSPNGAYPSAMVPFAGTSAVNSPPSLSALVIALQRRWLLGFAAGLAAACAAVAAVVLVFPPKYVAQTRLELASRPVRPLLTERGGENDVDPSIYRANQQAIFKSPLVLSNALNSEKLRGLPIAGQSPEDLEKALKVDFTQGPEIMTIRLFGDQPEYLADLLSAVLHAYIKEIETRDNQRRTKQIAQLQKSLQENEKTLADKRFELRNEERKQKIPDPVMHQSAYQALSSRLAGTDNHLRTVRADLSKKKLDLLESKARLVNVDTEPPSPSKIKLLLNTNPIVQQYAMKIATLQEEVSKLLAGYPESKYRAEVIQTYTDQMAGIKKSAQETEDALRPVLEKQLRGELQETLEQDIRKLTGNIEGLKFEEKNLIEALNEIQIELHALNPANNKGNVIVEKLRDDVKQIEKTQDKLAELVALQKWEPAASSRIVILQPPETPSSRDYSRFTKLATVGAVAAFGFGLFGIAFLEFRSRKISGVEEVTQGLGLTLVGTVPRLPASAQRPGPAGTTAATVHWQSIITESVDAIRTQLLYAARTDAVQVVMVTSASGGEGKTSLASQLSASLARAWRKTLLVDGDLRNPAAHKLFGLPLEPGFSELLRGEVSVAGVVKPTQLSRLWMITAGHWDAHAIQALAQDGVRSVFEQLKEQYDFIIVDSCPVLPVADSLLLGQHVDAVIFSVLRDVSRLPSVQMAHHKLQSLGVRMLGAVVIGAEGHSESSAYRYSHPGVN